MDNKRILIISLQGIGDLLMVTPLIKSLKEALPKAYIAVLTFEANAQILKNNPHIDRVLTIKKGAFIESIKLVFMIKNEKFDIAIASYPSGIRSGILALISGIPNRFAHNLSIYKKHKFLFTKTCNMESIKHAVLLNLDFLRFFNIKHDSSNNMVLNLTTADELIAQDIYRKYDLMHKINIVIHVGGGKDAKIYRSWPLKNYAQLCNELSKMDEVKLIFIGGREDKIFTDRVISLMSYPVVNLVGLLSLTSTAAVIRKSNLFIGNNSAPMHIAASLKIPTITIFGCVDKRLHHPWGNDYVILQKDMDCCPCYYPFITDTLEEAAGRNGWINKQFRCIKGNYECFSQIKPEDFLKEVRKKINNENL
jgi:ADP-heptose:LPS heptosyltransferase